MLKANIAKDSGSEVSQKSSVSLSPIHNCMSKNEGCGGSCCTGRKFITGEEKFAVTSADLSSQRQFFGGSGAVVVKSCR